jgi:hypothetical protein
MKVLLPTPGTPLMPKPQRFAGMRQHGCQQLIGLGAVVCAGGLQQRDGLGHGTALHSGIAVHDAFQQRWLNRCVHNHWRQAMALRICSSTSLALAGMGVPGPYTPFTPASYSMS